jgi:hypothetical protein
MYSGHKDRLIESMSKGRKGSIPFAAAFIYKRILCFEDLLITLLNLAPSYYARNQSSTSPHTVKVHQITSLHQYLACDDCLALRVSDGKAKRSKAEDMGQ